MPPSIGTARRILSAAALAGAFLFAPASARAAITIDAAPPSAYSPAFASVGYWHLDAGTGTVAADTSGTGNNGLITCLTAACVSTPTFVAGPAGLGTALEFAGLDNTLLRVPNVAAYNFVDDITVSAWVKPSTLSQPNGAGIIVRGDGGAEDFALDVSGGYYRFTAKPLQPVISSIPITAGVWTHLLAVYQSAGLATLYVNGQYAAAGIVTPPRTNSGHVISIGNRQSGAGAYDRGFLGSIDAPRIQHLALTAAQALAEYQESFISTVTPTAPNNGILIGLAPNAFGAPADLHVSGNPLANPITITPAILDDGLTVIPAGYTLVANSLIEIVPHVAGVPFTQNMGSSANVSMPYVDVNGDNIIDGSSPPLAASAIKTYTLNTTVNRWETLPSTVDPVGKRVIASTPHFSVFALFAPATFGAAASQVRVYPIPWRPGSGGKFDAPGVTFDRLPATGTIRVLSLSGERLREFTFNGASAGTIEWDGLTDSGRRAANGVYFARVTGPDNSATLVKFAVER